MVQLLSFSRGRVRSYKLDDFKTNKSDLTPHKVPLVEGEAEIQISLIQSEDKIQKS